MSGLLEVLRERGFLHQTTGDEALARILEEGPVTVYAGFDPSASSLHVGNLVPILALMHFARAGHRPIVIIGGGTGLVGDPSGKQEMRKLLDSAEVERNLEAFRGQLSRFLDFSSGKALLLNNVEWLAPLNYIRFLREIGRHFTVNRMLAAECFKTRYDSEAGLSFLEFNYMLLQAYDFLELHRRHGCRVQLGGSDQWGNIVAGADLIRRVEGKEAFGVTFPLITTARGAKMGKTAAGAVWIDAARTSPYEFYQYWINTDDRDVGRFLRLFTFLPLEEVRRLEALQGADLRRAKEVLAMEVTTLVHGPEEAENARTASRQLFGGQAEAVLSPLGPPEGTVEGGVPSRTLARSEIEKGPLAVNLFADLGLAPSRAEARRLARQGGLYLNGQPVKEDRVVTAADLLEDALELRVGKKRHLRVKIS